VAARVFYEVEQSRIDYVRQGPLTSAPYIPKFVGLSESFKDIAAALISLNVDCKNSAARLLDRNDCSVNVSAAITIILFSVLGAAAAAVSGWMGLEQFTAGPYYAEKY
jgi:hypothetical protein